MEDPEIEHGIPGEIIEHYELGMERQRLLSPGGELEFLRTQEIVSRFISPPPGVILDIGGGPGTYALWLAKLGYQVHLIDPIALHIDQARIACEQKAIARITKFVIGDARDLDYPKNTADTALLFGPLYHLTSLVDRLEALREAFRILKPGGLIFAVGISRFASTYAGLIEGYISDPEFVKIARRDVADGQHRNPLNRPDYFTTAYFHHPNELKEEIITAGFELLKLVAVEGPAIFLQDLDKRWTDINQRGRILEAVRWLEEDPAVIGTTGHFIAVARKQI